MKQPVYVGVDTYINGDSIVSIMDPSCSQAKKLRQKAKEEDRLLDFTCGKNYGSEILLNDNHVILSNRTSFQIVSDIWKDNENEKDTRNE